MVSTRTLLPRRPSHVPPASLLASLSGSAIACAHIPSCGFTLGGSRRLVHAALLLGLAVRLAALPYPGTGDVMIWKVWAYSGAVVGTSRMYGVGGTSEVPAQYHTLRFGALEAIADYPPLALYELGAAARVYQRPRRTTDGRTPQPSRYSSSRFPSCSRRRSACCCSSHYAAAPATTPPAGRSSSTG